MITGPAVRARTRPARSYDKLRRHWHRIAAAAGGHVDELSLGTDSLFAVDIGSASSPTVLLSAGIHGDEPAAIAALASLVADDLLDRRYSYRILPCINPSGFRTGTRFNASGSDINRSFAADGSTPEAQACIAITKKRRYVLSIDLHEDDEAAGFYAYDLQSRSSRKRGSPIVAALDSAELPVQELTPDFDLGYAGPTDGRAELDRGRVISSFEQQASAFTGWPFATFLLAAHTKSALIFETPQNDRFHRRVRMHRLAVMAAIAQLDR
jgi:protein MpaA